MSKFKIIHNEGVRYKKDILQFWDDYLPGTPHTRFDWMQNNPAGPPVWFLAIDTDSENLLGTVSVMPRKFVLNGTVIRAGIIGDYMVHRNHRVFGPALQLQKMVIEKMSDIGFNFIYSVPNAYSLKVLEKVGYKQISKLCCLVKPLKVEYYLGKYANIHLSKFVAPMLNGILKLLSKETYLRSDGFVEEVLNINDSFDILWNAVVKQQSGLIGDHSATYLEWRYFNNPVNKYRLLTYKDTIKKELLGYLMFAIIDGKVEIFDLIGIDIIYAEELLKKLIAITRQENCKAIYVSFPMINPWLHRLKPYLFFDAQFDAAIYFYGKKEELNTEWYFFSGDRNI